MIHLPTLRHRMPARRGAGGWASLRTVGVTVAALVLTELIAHGPWDIPSILGVTALLGTLLAVVYAAHVASFVAAVEASLLIALYTAHFVSPHGDLVRLDGETLSGAAVMLGLGVGTGGVVAILRTRERRLHERLLETERSYARELERKNEELRRANEALEAFSYVVGHDLKEPVRAVGAYLDAAHEDGYPAAAEHVRRAREANRRMAILLGGLLEWSRAGLGPLELEPIPLREIVESDACRGQYARLLEERNGSLQLATGLPTVMGARPLLAQIVGNLIVNALKHSDHPDPVVRIRHAGHDESGRAIVVIEDDGPGFPPSVVTRFDSLKVSRPSSVKGGFGLAITKRAVERIGGAVRLGKSELGGAAVEVALPTPPASPGVADRAAELV